MSALIARRYAKGLLAAISDATEQSQVECQLNVLADAYQNPAVQQFFENPNFHRDERLDFVKNLDLHTSLLKCFELLIDRNRASLLLEIHKAFRIELDRKLGRVRARITSARVLDEAQAAQVAEALCERMGIPVLTENEVNPAILGGIRAQIGGLVFDNTLQTQFSQLRRDLCN